MEWTLRILFVLCCAMVLLMAFHGDERGRRPRFIWRSIEDTIKVSKLQTADDRGDNAFDIAPPDLAIVAEALRLVPVAPRLRSPAPFLGNMARKIAYLRPFGIGPPGQA